MDAILPSKTLSYSEVFAKSFRLYRASFSRVIFFSVVIALIAFAPRLISYNLGYNILKDASSITVYKVGIFLLELIGLIFFICILWRMHCVYKGKNEPLAEDFKMGFKRLFSAFIAAFIQAALVFFLILLIFALQLMLYRYELMFLRTTSGLILTTVVALVEFFLLSYGSLLLVFMLPIVAVENTNPLYALDRSIKLVWDHWLRVFSVQITPWICYVLLLGLLRYYLKLDINIYFVAKGGQNISAILVNLLIFTLFIPWISAILLVQLQDLEFRKALLAKNAA